MYVFSLNFYVYFVLYNYSRVQNFLRKGTQGKLSIATTIRLVQHLVNTNLPKRSKLFYT